MPSRKTSAFKRIGLLLGICLLSAACGTVVPHAVEGQKAVLTLDKPTPTTVSGVSGWIISADLRDRYNGLIKLYGDSKNPAGLPNFIPALDTDAGLVPQSDGTYFIPDLYMTKFGIMAGWYRQGRKS
jgi:hypothetical protein